MNPITDAIKTRRSVRSYLPKPVPREVVNAVIEAGNEAPSAMNSQPWRFVVVEAEAAKKKLLGAALPNARKLLDPVKQTDPERYEAITKRFRELPDPIYYSAPVIIFVIGWGRYAQNSCPLACENMMLAAHSMGLGTCWVGFGSMVGEDREIKGILDLKDDETIFGPILLGYPAGLPERPPKKAPSVKWV